MAENNVILEDCAKPIRAVCDALPAEAMTEKATDFRVGEWGRDEWSPNGRIDTRYALKRNSNAGEFFRNVNKPIN
jgi:hypothetical protein